MTLLNWYVGNDRAVVVADSLCTYAGEPAAFQWKPHLVPHAAMIIMGRGPDELQWRCAWDLGHRHYVGGIDGAEAILPGLLATVQAELEERFRRGSVPGEIAAVGYSPAQQRYRAVLFQSTSGFEAQPQPPGIYISPGPPGYRPSRTELPTDAQWIASAKEQQRVLAKEAAPHWCSVGGDLFRIDLSLAGIAIRKLCRLPMYDEAVELMRRREGVTIPSPVSPLVDA
jgi:hypothetical protein